MRASRADTGRGAGSSEVAGGDDLIEARREHRYKRPATRFKKLPKDTPVEVGQERSTLLGVVKVKSKYVGASGRWLGRWWVSTQNSYKLTVWTTGELQEYEVLVEVPRG